MVAVRSDDVTRSGPPALRAASPAEVLAAIPAPADAAFAPVLDALVEHAWRRVTRRAPPELLRAMYMRKIRAGFSTYAALGISAMVCSRARPRALRVAARAAASLGLSARALASLGRRALPAALRLQCGRELERVGITSFLILALDEVLDDRLVHLPARHRAAALAALVRSGSVPEGEPLSAFCAQLLAELRRGSTRHERAALHLLLEDVAGWAWDEVALELDQGPEAPRRKTIEVSMRLLAFAAPGYVGPAELAWMTKIAELGQRVDDLLDAERDLALGRKTPVVTGAWTLAQAETLYRDLIEETRALVDEPYAPLASLFEQTFRGQLRQMAEILAANP